MNRVTPNKKLMTLPYLRPRYDDPKFIVASLWRRYAGWYTQDPATLAPVPKEATGSVLLGMVPGGPDEVAAKALAVAGNGKIKNDVGAALELIDFVAAAAPN